MSANFELLCTGSPFDDDDEDLPSADLRPTEKLSERPVQLWARIAALFSAARTGLGGGVDRVQANLKCA